MIENCIPYSQDACKAAAESDSKLNWKSAGNYGTKGCYAYYPNHPSYANNVYYSVASYGDMKKTLEGSSSIFRPHGHDCTSNNHLT